MRRAVLVMIGCVATTLCTAWASAQPAFAAAHVVLKPNPPQNVSVQAAGRQLTLSWLVLADDGWGGPIDNYLATIIGPTGEAQTKFSPTPPITFTGLRHGTYSYYLAAHNAEGWGHTTATGKISVPSEPDRMAVPHASSVKADTVTVTWIPPGSDGLGVITGYQVLFDGDVYDEPATAREATFGALGGTTHTVRVRAGNAWGFGDYSGTHYAHARGTPGPVLAVDAVVSGTTVSVTWTPPDNDGGRDIASYRVRVFSGSYVQQVGAVDHAEFDGLRPDADYRVGVAPVGYDPSDGFGTLTGPEYKVMIHTGAAPATSTMTPSAPATSTMTLSSPAPGTPSSPVPGTPSSPVPGTPAGPASATPIGTPAATSRSEFAGVDDTVAITGTVTGAGASAESSASPTQSSRTTASSQSGSASRATTSMAPTTTGARPFAAAAAPVAPPENPAGKPGGVAIPWLWWAAGAAALIAAAAAVSVLRRRART